jgi:hypothetical protein
MAKHKTDVVLINRNLQLPKYVWDALDEEAERCGRSGVKQLLALLTAYYNLGDVELNQEGLGRMHETMERAIIYPEPRITKLDPADIPVKKITPIISPERSLTTERKKGGRK